MKILNRVILASKNPHKIKRLTEIVTPFFKEIIPLTKVDPTLIIKEDKKSLKENAILKANLISLKFNSFSVATDGGIWFPFLKSWDKTKTRRFVRENEDDLQRIKKILEIMKDKKDDKERIMQWEEVIAFSFKGKNLFSYTAYGPNGILQKNYNVNYYQEGIWLCSLWYIPEYKKNYFELTEKEKREFEINWKKMKYELRAYIKEKIYFLKSVEKKIIL